MAIRITLCCNDPETGLSENTLAAFDIGELASFECRYGDWWPKLILERKPPEPGFEEIWNMRIGGKKHLLNFRLHEETSSPGWAARCFYMPGVEIVRMLNEPKIREWFQCVEAYSPVFAVFQNNRLFTQNLLRAL